MNRAIVMPAEIVTSDVLKYLMDISEYMSPDCFKNPLTGYIGVSTSGKVLQWDALEISFVRPRIEICPTFERFKVALARRSILEE